jgi:TolA-binding protein
MIWLFAGIAVAAVLWAVVSSARARAKAFSAITDAARAAEKEIREDHAEQRKQLEQKGEQLERKVPEMIDEQLEREMNR